MKPLTKTVAKRGGGIAARFVANEPVANKPRYAKWRERNPELYRERQRKLMRKRRAKEAVK